MIKNIIFDIGGVIANFDPIRVLRDMGLTENQVQVIAKNTLLGPWWVELDRGVMSKEEVFAKMLSDLSGEMKEAVPIADKFLNVEIVKTVTSFDYSKKWLSDLKKRGYTIYLLTNYPGWLFDYHWEHTFSFTESVTGAFVSGKEKIIKPDDAIYQGILNRFGLNPSECVFLDDRSENVEGAKRNGINAIHFTSFEEASRELDALLASGLDRA
ncbi:MAG: HAD family phosphatase [Treponemataceae bacterium]|nr:HAD family phosphatase [Treponemataceae bacterium]